MDTENLEVRLVGRVEPPRDMVRAAKETLGERYDDFVKQYPGEITPQKLCKYLETHTWP